MNQPVLTYENLPRYQEQLVRANIPPHTVNLKEYLGHSTQEVQQVINILKMNEKRKNRCRPQQ